MMRARRVGLLYGWMWIKQGIWLFRRNAFLWMFLTSILVVGMAGMAMLPILGGLLFSVLFPAFLAGLMLGCHALAEEKPLELNHLFAGFQHHGTALIALGVISTVLKLLIIGALMLGGGEELIRMIGAGQQPPNPQQLSHAVEQAGMVLPLVLVLLMLLQTAVPLAAMLIVFRAVPPLVALLAALRAVLLNLLPLLVYGLMVLPFAILATLPAMLGWLVLLPVVITSQYAIYRDIFPMPSDIAPPSASETPESAT